MLGALPAWTAPHRDLDKARAELKASGIKNPTVSLGFASDQPGRAIVATRDLTGLDFNPTWSIDLAAVRGSA